MQLVDPTDYKILAFLATRGRNNAVNIAAALEYDRSYVNTRLRALANAELVERVGPAANSGLYELTEEGRDEVTQWTVQDASTLEELDFEEVVEIAEDD